MLLLFARDIMVLVKQLGQQNSNASNTYSCVFEHNKYRYNFDLGQI